MEEGQVGDVRSRMLHLVEGSEVENEIEEHFDPRLRIKAKAVLIQKIGNQLHCSIITIAKAQLIFHKLQRLVNREIDTWDVAAACLSLSIRSCHEDVTSEEVILKFYQEQDLDPISEEEIQNMKTKLRVMVVNIMSAFDFKLKFTVAHTYVFEILEKLRSLPGVNNSVMVSMSTSATKLLSTYYLCQGCLDFDAFEIATCCLQFAYSLYGIFIPSIHDEMKNMGSGPNKYSIWEDMIIVSDVATTLNPI